MKEKEFLDERTRAEDIILGSQGFGESARLLSIKREGEGYSGVVQWDDGDTTGFSIPVVETSLERWALSVLLAN